MKAIETIYNGYRFRSRLEARWAVFLDVMGIPYEYEKEGYDLDGMRYLPDFWLPEQKCFVEIKGQSPTDEEERKAMLLGDCTGEDVFLFSGNISPDMHAAYGFIPPRAWVNRYSRGMLDIFEKVDITKEINIPQHIALPLTKLYSIGAQLSLGKHGPTLSWTVDVRGGSFSEIARDIFAITMAGKESVQGQFEEILQYEQELMSLLKLGEIVTSLGYITQDFEWVACQHCKRVQITRDTQNAVCQCFSNDEERILAAYTAARQARFEHGEKGLS